MNEKEFKNNIKKAIKIIKEDTKNNDFPYSCLALAFAYRDVMGDAGNRHIMIEQYSLMFNGSIMDNSWLSYGNTENLSDKELLPLRIGMIELFGEIMLQEKQYLKY